MRIGSGRRRYGCSFVDGVGSQGSGGGRVLFIILLVCRNMIERTARTVDELRESECSSFLVVKSCELMTESAIIL